MKYAKVSHWHELLPFVMHAYHTSVHIRLWPGYAMHWKSPMIMSDIHYYARLPDGNAYMTSRQWIINFRWDRGFYANNPPAAQKKLGSPWVETQQVVLQATGHTVGIQKGPDTPIIFIHVDDLKICPATADAGWTPGPSTAKSLCTSTVAFRPGSIVSNSDSTPSVIVSTCSNASHTSTRSNSRCHLDDPIDLTDHILSPFFVKDLYYQGCRFHSITHLMCFRYAVLHGLSLFATSVRKWTRHLTDFPTSRFHVPNW